ncbi:MAG: redoxin family protein [Pseudomonadota bacterium]
MNQSARSSGVAQELAAPRAEEEQPAAAASAAAPASVSPHWLVWLLVASLVAIVALPFLLALGSAVENERTSHCQALNPTTPSSVLGKLPQPAPPTFGIDRAGRRLDLTAFKGRTVLLNFWAPWCATCVEEIPGMEHLQHELGNDEPFTVLSLASEPDWQGLDEMPRAPGFPVLLDIPEDGEGGQIGNTAKRYGTVRLPESYLIDKNGNVRYYFMSNRDWSSETAFSCVRSLIEE